MGASSSTAQAIDPNNHTIPMLETGDIVLFKCKNGKKVLQKQQMTDNMTNTLNSTYHHVGIILRTHVDGYKVIDWSVADGIGCTSLADQLNDNNYTGASIRKLVTQLRNKQVDRLNQFLQKLKTTPSDDGVQTEQAATGMFCGFGGKKAAQVNAFTADRPNKGWNSQAMTELEFDFLLAALAQQTFRSAASFVACCFIALELLPIDTNYLAFTPASFSQPADSPNALRLANGAYLDESVMLPMHTSQLVFRRTAVAPITTVHGTTQQHAYSQQMDSQHLSEHDQDYLRAHTYSQRLVAAANDAVMNKHTSLNVDSSSSFSTNSSFSGQQQIYTQQATQHYRPQLNSQDQEILNSTSEMDETSHVSALPFQHPANMPTVLSMTSTSSSAATTGSTTANGGQSSAGQVHIAPMSGEHTKGSNSSAQRASNSSIVRTLPVDSDQLGNILADNGVSPSNMSQRESHENADFRVVMAQSAALALLGKSQPAHRPAQRYSQHQLPHMQVMQVQQPAQTAVNYHPPQVRQQLLHQRLPDFSASGTVRSTVPELSLEVPPTRYTAQHIASVPTSVIF